MFAGPDATDSRLPPESSTPDRAASLAADIALAMALVDSELVDSGDSAEAPAGAPSASHSSITSVNPSKYSRLVTGDCTGVLPLKKTPASWKRNYESKRDSFFRNTLLRISIV